MSSKKIQTKQEQKDKKKKKTAKTEDKIGTTACYTLNSSNLDMKIVTKTF